MFRRLICLGCAAGTIVFMRAAASDCADKEIRDLIAKWNEAYVRLDARTLASMETPDFELIDRFGHWVKSEGPEFNERLWSMTFNEIYHGKPGPPRQIESVKMFGPRMAIVQARAHHADGVILDDGTRIPPFWEIDTYTLTKTKDGWRIALLNIHNQMTPGTERPGERVPAASQKR